MSNVKGSRLDVDGVRARVNSIMGDVHDNVKGSTESGEKLTPLESFLIDSITGLSTCVSDAVRVVECDYAVQDARESASQEVIHPVIPELRWTRHTETLWDCQAGTDLWLLENTSGRGPWYLVYPRGNCQAMRAMFTARQDAHAMIHEYYAYRAETGKES